MTEMTHEEIRALVASYALGAVALDEASEVRSHLLECDECTTEADALTATVNVLSLVAAEEVPPGFEAAIMSRITDQRAEPAARRAPRWRLAHLGVAVLSIACLVLTFSLVQTRSDLSASQDAIDSLLARAQFELEGDEDVEAGVVALGQGSALIVKGLEPAPEGKDYQLWLLGDEAPVSGGTFDAEDGFVVVPTDLDAADFSGAAVSVEPDGGSEGPTTEPFLVSGG